MVLKYLKSFCHLRLISLVVLRFPQLRELKLFYVTEQAVHSVIFPALEPTLVDLYRV